MKKEKPKIPKSNRKKKIARVVRKKMSKTAIVEIAILNEHPYYHKRYKTHRRLSVLDENDKASAGQRVEIEECRPISKNKKWKIVDIIE